MKRYERLTIEDDYKIEETKGFNRPSTKPRSSEFSSTMYKEQPRKAALSCLRLDDFEIYLRSITYEKTLSRPMQKFVAKLKWLPITAKFDIFKEMH